MLAGPLYIRSPLKFQCMNTLESTNKQSKCDHNVMLTLWCVMGGGVTQLIPKLHRKQLQGVDTMTWRQVPPMHMYNGTHHAQCSSSNETFIVLSSCCRCSHAINRHDIWRHMYWDGELKWWHAAQISHNQSQPTQQRQEQRHTTNKHGFTCTHQGWWLHCSSYKIRIYPGKIVGLCYKCLQKTQLMAAKLHIYPDKIVGSLAWLVTSCNRLRCRKHW